MKPGSISETSLKPAPVGVNWDNVKGLHTDNPFSFQDFTVPQPMPQHEVAPPPHVWEKIARVLDDQEQMKAQAQASFAKADKKIHTNRKQIIYAAIGMLIGAIVLSLV
jgi:hypothetical protein